jgi:hypothetical protein
MCCGYDVLGNLTRDTREQIAQIDWTVAGKVKSVTRTTGSTLAALTEVVYPIRTGLDQM